MSRDPFVRLGAPGEAQVARRRRRRLLARYRRYALALAVAVLAAVSVRALSPAGSPTGLEAQQPPVGATAGVVPAEGLPAVPADRVLVTVVPADAAVLALAVPGRSVDLYAVSTWDAGSPEPARQLAAAAPVVRMPSPGADPSGGQGAAALQPGGTSALALAVTTPEAERIASAQGQALTVAVLADP